MRPFAILCLGLAACRVESNVVAKIPDAEDSGSLSGTTSDEPADSGTPVPEEVCNGEDDDADGLIDEDFADTDADGIADCVDTEVCDGQDNDGDGEVDEAGATGETLYFADADGDGYGVAPGVLACSPPADHVAQDDDCDDTNAAIYPDASEVCNNIDDDCDARIDDEDDDLDVSSAEIWYADTDNDGHGAADTFVWACTQPSGFGDSRDDCDDSRDTVFPGADETCNDIDDDCDGVIDSGACNCDLEVYDGRDYWFCSTPLDQAAAVADCASWGAALVSISDSAENSFLTTTALAYGWYGGGLNEMAWIGFNDAAVEGTFEWVSGEAVSYRNWSSGEPNDQGGEDCVCLNYTGMWNDYPCTGTFPYICEGP